MKVQVDRDACEANGVCVGLVPEVFELDDDDDLHILAGDVPAGLLPTVQLAVRSCPKAALRLAEQAEQAQQAEQAAQAEQAGIPHDDDRT